MSFTYSALNFIFDKDFLTKVLKDQETAHRLVHVKLPLPSKNDLEYMALCAALAADSLTCEDFWNALSTVHWMDPVNTSRFHPMYRACQLLTSGSHLWMKAKHSKTAEGTYQTLLVDPLIQAFFGGFMIEHHL